MLLVGNRNGVPRGRTKCFETEHIRLQFFFTIYVSVKRAFFTDSHESATDVVVIYGVTGH